MLNQKPLYNIIFLDIETCPQHESFFEMSERKQELFKHRFHKKWQEARIEEEMATLVHKGYETQSDIVDATQTRRRAMIEELYQKQGPLFCEFNKIICISLGWFNADAFKKSEYVLDTKSYFGEDEKKLLTEFYTGAKSILDSPSPLKTFAAFNGKGFDFPIIAKRMILNGMPIPTLLDTSDKKPWEVNLIDPKESWKFGVWDDQCSLDLLCETFGVVSSKEGGITGAQVRDVYYIEKDLPKIVKYCERDIYSTAVLYLRMKSIQDEVKLNLVLTK